MESNEFGLDRQPRSDEVRLLAALAYVPLVAVFLLFAKKGQEVRLVRFHAIQALALGGLLLVGLLAVSVGSGLLGLLPVLGLWLNVVLGLVIVGMLLLAVGISFHGAWTAYQGAYTRFPWLTAWVWQRVNLPPSGVAPPRRRRRRVDGTRAVEGLAVARETPAIQWGTTQATASESPVESP